MARKPYQNREPVEIARGEGFSLQFTVYSNDAHTTYADISSGSISLTWKLLDKRSDTALVTKTSASITEIEKTDPTNGVFLVKLASTDTSSLNVGSYRFDVLLTNSGTTPTTKRLVAKGEVVVTEGASL